MVDPEQKSGATAWPTSGRTDAIERRTGSAHAGAAIIGGILQHLATEVRGLLGARCCAIHVALDRNWTCITSAAAFAESALGDAPCPRRLTREQVATFPPGAVFGVDGSIRPLSGGLLMAPLAARDGGQFGVVQLTDKLDGDFTAEDESTLAQLARIVALAVENATVYAGERGPGAVKSTPSSFLSLLCEIGKTLGDGAHVRTALQSCAATLATHLSGALCRIWVQRDGILTLDASAGMCASDDPLYDLLALGQFTVGQVAQSRHAQAADRNDVGLDHIEREWLERNGLTSIVAVPLLADDDLEGVLAVFGREPLPGRVLEALLSAAPVIALHIKRNRAAPANVPAPVRGPAEGTGICLEHAVVITDENGTIRTWNLDAERLFGYAHDEVVGRRIDQLMSPQSAAECRIRMAKAHCGDASTALELTCRSKTGGAVLLQITFSPMGDGKSPAGIVLVAHDANAVQRLEQLTRQAQRFEIVGQLAGGVAHDFNNVLTVVLGYSEVLLRRLDAKDSNRDLVQEIHKAGTRAGTLTRQLLNLSSKQVIDMKVLDLNAIVSDTESMLRRMIGEDIVLTTKLRENLGPVTIDPGQMQQVILNLAVNARDAMPKGGKLTIETDNVTLDAAIAATNPNIKPGDYAMLAISDTGVGMNAGIKARIFEPLFTTKSPGKGTGLGLNAVKSILKQCGGLIEVYSEPGRGSSFKVYLPRVDTADGRRKKSNHQAPAMPRGKETVLLVEDDDCVRSLARHVLEICGYKVLEACDGADALCRFERQVNAIDLLVSDVVMPFLDGRALADRLLTAKPHMKVLFVSGYPNDAVVRHGVLDSDDTFLQKPFTTCSLAQKVRQVLDQKV